jgi:queuine tRNA-ribosyltransferase
MEIKDFYLEIKHVDKETGARYGFFHTPHGTSWKCRCSCRLALWRPSNAFRPKRSNPFGAGVILANTYHLHLQPGEKIVAEAGGLHKFMNYDGPMLTDSGGFQVFSLQSQRKITEEGVEFRNDFNGDKEFFTPEKVIEIEEALGADIIMSFDECIPYPAD